MKYGHLIFALLILPVLSYALPSNINIINKTLAPTTANNYTLQLYNTYDHQEAINFIVNNKLLSKAAFYKTSYMGQNKYVVIYGNYASRKQALAAIQILPSNLQAWNPITKPFSTVRQEMKP